MIHRILSYSGAIGSYILRKVLIFAAGIVFLVGLSFLIWAPFNFPALSERLVWTGIGVAMIAGILVFGQAGGGGSNYGVPGQFITPTHANVLTDWNIEIRKNIESRFDFRFQVFLIGAIVFVSGIVVDLIARSVK